MLKYQAKIYQEKGNWIAEIEELGIYTFGDTLKKAKSMVQEALDLRIEDEEEIPSPMKKSGKNLYTIEASKHIALAFKLKEIRKEIGLTQSEMAKRLGFSYQAYQKLENSRVCNPTIKRIEKIEKAIGRELVKV